MGIGCGVAVGWGVGVEGKVIGVTVGRGVGNVCGVGTEIGVIVGGRIIGVAVGCGVLVGLEVSVGISAISVPTLASTSRSISLSARRHPGRPTISPKKKSPASDDLMAVTLESVVILSGLPEYQFRSPSARLHSKFS